MRILFIGQCTFHITLDDGTTFLTDPWFKNNPLFRAVPPARSPDDIHKLDYLISSHNHLDHLDSPSLLLAKRTNATVIGSERVAKRARKFGINNVVGLKPGEKIVAGCMNITATPAFHPLAKDAIGLLINAEDKTLYFCGDTRPHANLSEFLRNSGKIDIAFLQIACAVYFGKDDGMNIRTAAEFAKTFMPRIVIPMHYHGRFKEADPQRFKEKLAGSNIEATIIVLGEQIEV